MITPSLLSSDPVATTINWAVGDVVAISHPNYQGLKGVIYQVYEQPSAKTTGAIAGFSLLIETGENVIGWEPISWRFITRLRQVNLVYTFTDVKTLTTDFNNGVFEVAFKGC